MTAATTEIVSAAPTVSHAKPALEFISLNVIDFLPQASKEASAVARA